MKNLELEHNQQSIWDTHLLKRVIGYIVLLINFLLNRDVSFKESIFPFKTTTFTDRRPNVEHFVDVDDAFIIDPTPKVSEIALDPAVAPQPSLEVSSTLNPDVLAPKVIQQPHLTSPPAIVMPHPTLAPLHDMPEEVLRKSTRTSKPTG